MGMRVLSHGGMVNLNESHPTLIIGALGLDLDSPTYMLTDGNTNPEIPFYHRPSMQGVKYSPQLEEPVLRRRGMLPPRIIAPSLLHGNALLAMTADNSLAGGDMVTKLFSPNPPADPLGVGAATGAVVVGLRGSSEKARSGS